MSRGNFDRSGPSSRGSTNKKNRSTMSGGQLKDYTNLSSDRFQASNLTQVGNSVGYSTYGKSAGSNITVTENGKFRLTPSDGVAEDLGVAATDFDTLDEAFVMLDRFNDDPANTFARYNAAIQQGIDDMGAGIYSSNASYSNPSEVLEDPYYKANTNMLSFIEGRSEPTETDLQMYDLNKDGSINLNDSLALQKHVALRPTDEGTNLLNYASGTYKTETDSPYTTLNKDTRGYLDFTTNAERKAIGDYLLRQDKAAGISLSETIKKLEIMSGMAAPDLTEDYYGSVAEATAALYPEKFQFEGQLASGRYNVIDPDTGKAVTYKDKETYDNIQPFIAEEPQPTDPTDLDQNIMVDPDPIVDGLIDVVRDFDFTTNIL